MGKMKTLLLEAAIAIEKVLEADGTIEQVLETVDQISDIRVTTTDRETRLGHGKLSASPFRTMALLTHS